MEKEEWILVELERSYDNSQDYKLAALIRATQNIIKEQGKRMVQMEGEIDGTLWSPKRWGE